MKKILLLIISMNLLISIFCSSKEELFWEWFINNQNKLFHFEKNQDMMFVEISKQLHKINKYLTFEFGPIINDRRDFVISADGIIEAFPYVISLYNAKPDLDFWNIIKFRPRRNILNQIKYEDLVIKTEDIYYIIEKDNDKIGLNIYVKDLNKNDRRYLSCIFLILDDVLGEYDVETKVGFIDYFPLNTLTEKEKKKIEYLQKDFDYFYDKWFK